MTIVSQVLLPSVGGNLDSSRKDRDIRLKGVVYIHWKSYEEGKLYIAANVPHSLSYQCFETEISDQT